MRCSAEVKTDESRRHAGGHVLSGQRDDWHTSPEGIGWQGQSVTEGRVVSCVRGTCCAVAVVDVGVKHHVSQPFDLQKC